MAGPVRLVIGAVLVLAGPLARIALVPIAFPGFLVTRVFGFAMDAAHRPKRGMLASCVGALLGWPYLGVMGLFEKGPRGRA